MQCITKLRYQDNDKYGNSNNKNDFLNALSKSGNQVGELAKYYFSNGQDLSDFSDKEAIIKTNDLLINNQDIIIYEAAIIYKNLFARIDKVNFFRKIFKRNKRN